MPASLFLGSCACNNCLRVGAVRLLIRATRFVHSFVDVVQNGVTITSGADHTEVLTGVPIVLSLTDINSLKDGETTFTRNYDKVAGHAPALTLTAPEVAPDGATFLRWSYQVNATGGSSGNYTNGLRTITIQDFVDVQVTYTAVYSDKYCNEKQRCIVPPSNACVCPEVATGGTSGDVTVASGSVCSNISEADANTIAHDQACAAATAAMVPSDCWPDYHGFQSFTAITFSASVYRVGSGWTGTNNFASGTYVKRLVASADSYAQLRTFRSTAAIVGAGDPASTGSWVEVDFVNDVNQGVQCRWKGNYSSAVAYLKGDFFRWTDAKYYICADDTTAGQTPASHPAKFTLHALTRFPTIRQFRGGRMFKKWNETSTLSLDAVSVNTLAANDYYGRTYLMGQWAAFSATSERLIESDHCKCVGYYGGSLSSQTITHPVLAVSFAKSVGNQCAGYVPSGDDYQVSVCSYPGVTPELWNYGGTRGGTVTFTNIHFPLVPTVTPLFGGQLFYLHSSPGGGSGSLAPTPTIQFRFELADVAVTQTTVEITYAVFAISNDAVAPSVHTLNQRVGSLVQKIELTDEGFAPPP